MIIIVAFKNIKAGDGKEKEMKRKLIELMLVFLVVVPFFYLSCLPKAEAVGKTEKVYAIYDDLDIYSHKNMAGVSIGIVNIGTSLTVLNKDGYWINIQTPSGKVGWVFESWVTNDLSKAIKDLEAEVKPIPASDVLGNLLIYKRLSKLDPTNKKYKEKVTYYNSQSKGMKTSPNYDKEPYTIVLCYDLGYRWSKCAARSLKKLPCRPENDIIIPERCRDEEETQRGINDGKLIYKIRYESRVTNGPAFLLSNL